MQLENELVVHNGLDAIKNRYYDGFIRGGARIVRDEGVGGLYKGSAIVVFHIYSQSKCQYFFCNCTNILETTMPRKNLNLESPSAKKMNQVAS